VSRVVIFEIAKVAAVFRVPCDQHGVLTVLRIVGLNFLTAGCHTRPVSQRSNGREHFAHRGVVKRLWTSFRRMCPSGWTAFYSSGRGKLSLRAVAGIGCAGVEERPGDWWV